VTDRPRTCALPGSPLERERGGLDACVHCGFCLPACPTYLALEDENDSPRGRLVLMGALLDGRIEPDDPDAARHLDQCLGCRGCETACPSGVPYGRLLEATRETLAVERPLGWRARLVLAVFAREWALRPALALARLVRGLGLAQVAAEVLPRTLAMPAAMLAATARPASRAAAPPEGRPAPRGTATLLTGCVMEGLLAGVNRATERVLERHGYRMGPMAGQRCCGALHAHAGAADTARELARANIAAFEASGAEWIVSNSAGCGAMCREYAHLLHDDPAWATRAVAFAARVRDVHELLAEAGPDATPRTVMPTRVAWDAPCHLQHAQRVVAPPLAVLHAVGGVALVPLTDSDQCCGSAGIFTLVQPRVSERVLAPKLRHIAESGAAVVATANPGCLLQIGGGLLLSGSAVVARHPVELLDEGYAARGTTG
jgi:glycolate oxidase iron-sulfur subunit